MNCGCGRPKSHLGLCRYRRSLLPPQKRFTRRLSKIDLGLEILEMIRPPNTPIPLKVIAEICGCTIQNIQQTEARALRKLKHQ